MLKLVPSCQKVKWLAAQNKSDTFIFGESMNSTINKKNFRAAAK